MERDDKGTWKYPSSDCPCNCPQHVAPPWKGTSTSFSSIVLLTAIALRYLHRCSWPWESLSQLQRVVAPSGDCSYAWGLYPAHGCLWARDIHSCHSLITNCSVKEGLGRLIITMKDFRLSICSCICRGIRGHLFIPRENDILSVYTSRSGRTPGRFTGISPLEAQRQSVSFACRTSQWWWCWSASGGGLSADVSDESVVLVPDTLQLPSHCSWFCPWTPFHSSSQLMVISAAHVWGLSSGCGSLWTLFLCRKYVYH